MDPLLGFSCSVTDVLKLLILSLNLCSVSEVWWDEGTYIERGLGYGASLPLGLSG